MTDFTDEQIDAIAERERDRVWAVLEASRMLSVPVEEAKAAFARDYPGRGRGEPTKLESLPVSEAKEIFAKAFADAAVDPPATKRERWNFFTNCLKHYAILNERIDILQSQIDRQQRQLDAFEKVREGWDNLNEGCRKMLEGE